MYLVGLNVPVISDEMNRSNDPTFFMEELDKPRENISFSDSSSTNTKTAFSIVDDQTSDNSSHITSITSSRRERSHFFNRGHIKKYKSRMLNESNDSKTSLNGYNGEPSIYVRYLFLLDLSKDCLPLVWSNKDKADKIA